MRPTCLNRRGVNLATLRKWSPGPHALVTCRRPTGVYRLGAYRATVRLANTLSLGVALVGEPRSSPVERGSLCRASRVGTRGYCSKQCCRTPENLLDLLSQRIKHG